MKSESETELDNIKKNHGVESYEDKQNKNEARPASIAGKIKAVLNFFTVEPFLLLFIVPSVISSLAVQKLNMEKACRVDLNNSADICAGIVAGTANDSITKNLTQVLVAEMTSWSQPLQTGIPAIVILFVGAWSDRTGNRKALMLIPIFGSAITAFGLILATYFFLEWPLWVTALIESIPSALSGGFSIALMGSYSYLADVTTAESRTFRIGTLGIIVTLGIPFASSISGVLTEAVGYYGIFTIALVSYIIGFMHTYFRIHDIRNTTTEGTFVQKLILFFHPKNVWDTFSLIFLTRGRRLLQILLIIWAHIVIVGPAFGEAPLLFLYANIKFDMDVITFSLFTTYSILLGVVGSTIAITVFSKWLKIHDAILGMIATTGKVVSSFVYAFAPTRAWYYSAPVFDIFGGAAVIAIRSLGTKVVEPDQVGKLCSLLGFVEAVVPVIYTPIYSQVYAKTLSGLFYVVGGVMIVPAFFIFIILYVLYRRDQKDIVKDPAAKEAYAHENAVTAL